MLGMELKKIENCPSWQLQNLPCCYTRSLLVTIALF